MTGVVIRVVSLPGSPRRSAMTAQLAATGRDWAFFDAFDRQLSPVLLYLPARAARVFGRVLSLGELGCFASHHALWDAAARDPARRHHLVLEDDVAIDPAFLAGLDALVRDMVARGVPFLRLAATADGCRMYEGALGDRSVYRYLGPCWGAQGYILGPDGAARLHASVQCVERPVDNHMDLYWTHGMPNRVLVPFAVVGRATPSTLEEGRARLERGALAPRTTLRRLKYATLARQCLHGAQTWLALRWQRRARRA